MGEKLELDLFGEFLDESWRSQWLSMPEFSQEDLQPCRQNTLRLAHYPPA